MLPGVISHLCVIVSVYRTPTTMIASDSTRQNMFCFCNLCAGIMGLMTAGKDEIICEAVGDELDLDWLVSDA